MEQPNSSNLFPHFPVAQRPTLGPQELKRRQCLQQIVTQVDVSEQLIADLGTDTCGNSILEHLLRDQTMSRTPNFHFNPSRVRHIVWGTDNYAEKGAGFQETDQIQESQILNQKRAKDGRVIRPRALKTKLEQQKRVKQKAEVFTPSWVCNVQNNLVDEAWFGRKNVFNLETEQGRSWQSTAEGEILFPKGKTWQAYVAEPRMEMCCGEAPYLVSRYDTTTGEKIPLSERIGLFDRKMLLVHRNSKSREMWLRYAYLALKSTYGFEWQGDSLLIARENLLVSFAEYYDAFCADKHITIPLAFQTLRQAAYIISWNLFQMDGLTYEVPYSQSLALEAEREDSPEPNLFAESKKSAFIPPEDNFLEMPTFQKPKGRAVIVAQWSGEKHTLEDPILFSQLRNNEKSK